MKRYWPPLVLIAGTLIAMLSIAFNLTTLNQVGGELVEPQSVRGFESVHGSVIFTIAALLLAAGLLTVWERATEPRISRLVAGAMALGAVGIAAIYWTSDALLVVLVLVGAVLLFAAATALKPPELVANRMLIAAAAAGVIVVTASAAAARSNLLEAQLDLDGIAGQYADTRLAIGYYVALLGMLVATGGAMWMWSTRGKTLAGRSHD